MNYLVDADVLSEPTKPQPNGAVVAWLRREQAGLVLSAVTLGELRYGILKLPAGRKRTRLMKWFDAGVARFPTLDFDASVAQAWADLLAKLRRSGQVMPTKDSLVAATALRHGLTIATRNTKDYLNSGVSLVNPFDA